MKFLKFLLVFFAVLLLVGVTVSVTGWLMLRGTPVWYRAEAVTVEQQKTAASNVEQKLIHIHNWLAGSRARRIATSSTTSRPATSVSQAIAAHEPQQPFQIQFTDDELNAFFHKWTDEPESDAGIPSRTAESRNNGANRFQARLMETANQYITSPRLVFHDNKLILAALVKDFGTVVSLEFEPEIDADGNLEMNLQRVLGGILPLPDLLIAKRRDQLERLLTRKLAGYQRSANITPDGSANSAAAAAGMNQLLLAALARQPSEPVLYVPYNGDINRNVPLKLTALVIQGNVLTMTVEELDAPDRVALLQRLRGIEATVGSAMP